MIWMHIRLIDAGTRDQLIRSFDDPFLQHEIHVRLILEKDLEGPIVVEVVVESEDIPLP